MPHGLDHIVHAVRNLDAAADFYIRAGFTVGGRNRHPWGTHNRIVQLKNGYVEILEVAEPEKIVAGGPHAFSFGVFNRDFLAGREGLSMLLLNSTDASADWRAYHTAGISDFEVFDFAREGKRPDGTTVKLAFSLVFTRDPSSPELGLALCQHHFPENFWNPSFQTHANGTQSVGGVVMVANDPASHRDFLKAYTARNAVSNGAGLTIHTENGDIDVFRPDAARDRGISARPGGEGMTFDAIRFVVGDLAQTETLHRQNGLASRRLGEQLIVPPEEAFGATLIFEASKLG